MNLASIIDGHPDDDIALISRGRSTTYGELRAQVDRMRGGLVSVGLGEGDRIALIAGNGRPFVVAYLAAVGLGAVVVPLNPHSPAPELESEIAKIRAKVVLVEQVGAANWAKVDPARVPSVETVISTDHHEGGGDAVHFDSLLAADPVERVDVAPDALAVLIFTSGTAGAPKAAMLTHGNLVSSMSQSLSNPDSIGSDDIVYGVLPLFHIFGLNIVLGLSLRVGATIVLVQRFDPQTAAETIRDRGVTVVPGAPSMWTAFAHFDELDADSFATVRRALSGAARLPIPVAERMKERFGVEILEGYGLTEASPTVTTQVGHAVHFGSVGRALDGVEVRLVGADGADVLVGDVGEIWVRGDNVFPGYFEDPEATAAVLTEDGWLKTGDMALADDDGFMYLVDRAKDLVIVSGFNVYPAEVEEVLARHPDVAEVGVVGVPHPHTGEAVKAFVVTRQGADVDEETLIDFARDHLARYKCPNKIMFVDELPRNASGKLVRRSLADAMAIK